MQTHSGGDGDQPGFKIPAPPKPPDPKNPSLKRGPGRPRKNSSSSSDIPKKLRIGDDNSSIGGYSNIYDSLADDDDGDMSTDSRYRRKNPSRKLKTTAPPPIVIHNLALADINASLTRLEIKQADYRLQLTQFGTKLFVTTNSQFSAVKQQFTNEKISFFTYSLEEEKMCKFVLYGLPEINVDDIKKELTTMSLAAATVNKMSIKQKRHENHCLYLVSFPKSADMTLTCLQQVRGMLGFLVKWKRFQPRTSNVTQCSNCQAFGHASRNCKMPSNCMKCADNHKTENCPHNDPNTKRVPNDVLKCKGCGENHSARFRDCKKRIEFLNIKETVMAKNKKSFTNPYTSRAQHYSSQYPPLQMSRPSTSTFQPQQCSISYSAMLRRPTAASAELFTPQECFAIFEELYSALISCKSKAEQVYSISKITMKYLESAVPKTTTKNSANP